MARSLLQVDHLSSAKKNELKNIFLARSNSNYGVEHRRFGAKHR
jgi:hypothetical protein